jgi:predicted ribosome quality control (RQC) complex YloA/Tae2 family protein
VTRVANIYDVSGRLYLLKFSKANRKEHLLIESGIRIHTTKYIKNEKDLPSGFSMKLRKHLRTKKLDKIEQLGIDRVIDLTFGKGESAHHILVELYASGNVILTDHEYTILSLLRSHKFEENATIAVKQKYPFSHAANMSIDSITLDRDKIKEFIIPAPVAEEPKNENDKKG